MHIRVKADNPAVSRRVRQMLELSLAGYSADVIGVEVTVRRLNDRLGTGLTQCLIQTRIRSQDRIEVEDIQSDPELAMIRAMDRSLRTLQRRLGRAR